MEHSQIFNPPKTYTCRAFINACQIYTPVHSLIMLHSILHVNVSPLFSSIPLYVHA